MTQGSGDPPYDVRFTTAAAREIRKLRPDDGARLRRAILALAFEPRPGGVRPIVGTAYLRLRIGDLRVIYAVQDEARRVVIARIARRSESTYRRMV